MSEVSVSGIIEIQYGAMCRIFLFICGIKCTFETLHLKLLQFYHLHSKNEKNIFCCLFFVELTPADTI